VDDQRVAVGVEYADLEERAGAGWADEHDHVVLVDGSLVVADRVPDVFVGIPCRRAVSPIRIQTI
jgi:hypothetical protein